MTFKRSVFAFTLAASLAVTSAPQSLHANEADWSPLWLGKEKPTKGDTQLPDGLTASMFDLSEDDQAVVEGSDSVGEMVRDIAMEDVEGARNADLAESNESLQAASVYSPPNVHITSLDDRSPASVRDRKPTKLPRKAAGKTAGKANTKNSKTASKSKIQKVVLAKSTKPMPATMNTTAMASQAQSRWPSSASEGFEFRVRHKSQVSSMWVMKRQNRYDVVYATNGGSRVNLTIPPDQFYALTNAASELRSTTASTEKCRDSFVQVHVVSAGSGRAVASCLEAKGKDADKLRLLGATLSGFVR